MTNYIQRWLNAQAAIEASQRSRHNSIAQEAASQDAPISTIKETIKRQATEEYKRQSLAATIALCLNLPVHTAIGIADQLIQTHIVNGNWTHEELEEAARAGRLFYRRDFDAWLVRWPTIQMVNPLGEMVSVDTSCYNEVFRTIREAEAWQQLREGISSKPGVTGDDTCRFNARSIYLRCTVNPCGPCESCSHFEKRDE